MSKERFERAVYLALTGRIHNAETPDDDLRYGLILESDLLKYCEFSDFPHGLMPDKCKWEQWYWDENKRCLRISIEYLIDIASKYRGPGRETFDGITLPLMNAVIVSDNEYYAPLDHWIHLDPLCETLKI